MNRPAEPFVVDDGPERLIRLADVLITVADGRPPRQQLDDLFGTYPGLTLILLRGAGRLVEIGVRDGTTASLRLDPSMSARFAAVVLYDGWAGQLSANDLRPR
jgi:hypothetical protein